MTSEFNCVKIHATNRPIFGEVTIWHDDEAGMVYVIVEGPMNEECFLAEKDFFIKSVGERFMTDEFAILCQIRKSGVISPEAFLRIETFVIDCLNTRYLPVGIALVANPSIEGCSSLLPKIKEWFDNGVTPFETFPEFAEAENWLLQKLDKKR